MPILMLVMTSPRKLNVKERSLSLTLSLSFSVFLPSLWHNPFCEWKYPVNSSRAQECRKLTPPPPSGQTMAILLLLAALRHCAPPPLYLSLFHSNSLFRILSFHLPSFLCGTTRFVNASTRLIPAERKNAAPPSPQIESGMRRITCLKKPIVITGN
jgi:hypothetical protein